MERKRWFVFVLAFAMLLAGALVGCGGKANNEQAEATVTPIPTAVVPEKPTYKVARGTVTDEVQFTGRIAAVTEQELFFRVDGMVAKVNVQQGDKVKKGDVLAELEDSDLLNQIAQAKVDLEQAQLQLKNAEETTADAKAQAEINLAIAQLRLAQAQAQDPAPALKIAEVNREKAQIAVQLAQNAYDRRAGMDPAGVGGSGQAQQLQQATLDYQIAQAQYDQALQAQKAHDLDIQILQQDVKSAQLALAKSSGTVDPVLSQQVAKAQLVLDRLNGQLADAQIVAPFDGDVTMVGIYAGRSTTAYRPAIDVAAPGALEISAELTSDTMQKLSIGQPADIVIVNYPTKEFHGSIRRLPYPYGSGGSNTSGTADEDRSTRVSIDDADVTLEKGALVRVTVILQKKDNVLWLPPAAIRTFQGNDFVLVQEGAGQRRIPVKLGIKNADRVEIVDGLKEGQVVVGP